MIEYEFRACWACILTSIIFIETNRVIYINGRKVYETNRRKNHEWLKNKKLNRVAMDLLKRQKTS